MEDKIFIIGLKEIIPRESETFKVSVCESKAVEIKDFDKEYVPSESKIYNVNIWQKRYEDHIDKMYVAPCDDLTDEYMRMANDVCQSYYYWLNKHGEVLKKLTTFQLLSFTERLKFLFRGKKYIDKVLNEITEKPY